MIGRRVAAVDVTAGSGMGARVATMEDVITMRLRVGVFSAEFNRLATPCTVG